MGNRSITHTEEWIKSNLSGKIKVSPAAACGDHQLILRTPAGSLQPASLCVGYPPLHPSHCYAAPLVCTASAPFTGGDRGAAKAAETITVSCSGPGLAAVKGVMCRAAQSSCCFRPFKQEKATEDAWQWKPLVWLLWRSKIPTCGGARDWPLK